MARGKKQKVSTLSSQGAAGVEVVWQCVGLVDFPRPATKSSARSAEPDLGGTLQAGKRRTESRLATSHKMPVDYSKFDNIDTDSEDEAAPAAAAQNSAATPRLVTPQSTKKEGLPPPPQAKPSVPATPARRPRPAAPAPASEDFSSTAALVDGLALASTCAEVAKGANTEEALASARGFVYRLFELHTLPLVLDEQGWANPWALAARAIGKRAAASANREVAFLGVGSLVPAMAAAKAGASVTVYGRVRRLLEVKDERGVLEQVLFALYEGGVVVRHAGSRTTTPVLSPLIALFIL